MKNLDFAMMGAAMLTLAACSNETEQAAEDAIDNGITAEEIVDDAVEEANQVVEEVTTAAETPPPPPIAEEDLSVDDSTTEDVAGM